jgi:hypothetical protein
MPTARFVPAPGLPAGVDGPLIPEQTLSGGASEFLGSSHKQETYS